jgi:ATP-dependent DNA ligase
MLLGMSTVAERVVVAPGVALPFFPMRPMTGERIEGQRAVDVVNSYIAKGYIVQPKLNGDRVTLAKVNGKLLAQNRHGAWYSYNFDQKPWLSLPDGTCLDGEVRDKVFTPFEALSHAGKSLLRETAEYRVALAKSLCTAGRVWLFDAPSDDWLRASDANYPRWEGVVVKLRASPYSILGIKTDSPDWKKLKWPNAA